MLRLAGPVVLAELGWMAMGVVDTLMVAPLGPAAIGAAGIGNSMHMAFAIFGMGLLLGLDTLVSQAWGAGRVEECHRWLLHGLALGLAVSVPLTGLCLALLAGIPRFGFHPQVLPLLQGYFAVVLWSTVPLLVYAALRRYLQGMHVVAPIAFALVSANLVNAGANWALIYGHLGLPALGVTGSAWATVASRVYLVAVLAVTVVLLDRRRGSSLWQTPRTIARDRLARLVRLGLPAASQITLEVGVFAAATALAGKLMPVASASHQIALNIASVAFMIPLGIASAGAVRVGHAIGRADGVGARAAGWTALGLGGVVMALTGVLFLAVPGWLIGLFTQDPAVVALGSTLLLIAAVFQLFDGAQVVATGVLRGLGDTRTPMLLNLAGHWLLGLPVGYTLCFDWGYGVVGLWVGLSIGLISVGAVLIGVWQVKSRLPVAALLVE
ncbi:MAG: MATE family efflux transporter [Vicinamibacterales bacterium]